MARKAIDINIRMGRQEQKILRMRERLDKAQDDYEELVKEREAKEKDQLYEAFKKSKRSFQKVLDYLKGKADI